MQSPGIFMTNKEIFLKNFSQSWDEFSSYPLYIYWYFYAVVVGLRYAAAIPHLQFLKNQYRKKLTGKNVLRLAVQ
jgi:hypothetical protein